eukprot:scaffold27093_cov72-Phaeocystis_antarctica.AAC.4
MVPSATQSTSTTQGQVSGQGQLVSGSAAHTPAPRPSERHDACCRMSVAMAVWRLFSAYRRAVPPLSSSSSGSAECCSRACTHAKCPSPAAAIRAVWPLLGCMLGLAECCSRSSTMAWCPKPAAAMSAVKPRPVCRSTVAPRLMSSLTTSMCPRTAATCIMAAVVASPPSVETEHIASTDRPATRPATRAPSSKSTAPPSPSHSTTVCSSPRSADRIMSIGSAKTGELSAALLGSRAVEAAVGCGGGEGEG